MPSNARKNATTSSTTSVPTTVTIVRRNACTATPATRSDGARRHHEQPEDPVVEQPGEPPRRVEEVERVAGRWRVDDDEVEAAFVVQLVQLLHRHVLLRARQRAGDVAVEAVLEDPLAPAPASVALRVTSRSNVDFVSSISAESRPPSAPVAVRIPPFQRAVDLARRVRQVSSPSALARRLAGSIVTTTALRPLARAFDREHGRGRRLADAAACRSRR